MAVEANALVLRHAKPSCRLGDLVRRIRPENRHGEAERGAKAGQEVWLPRRSAWILCVTRGWGLPHLRGGK